MIPVKPKWYTIRYSKIYQLRPWPNDSDKSLLETANGKKSKIVFFVNFQEKRTFLAMLIKRIITFIQYFYYKTWA